MEETAAEAVLEHKGFSIVPMAFLKDGERQYQNLAVRHGEDPRKTGRKFAEMVQRGLNKTRRMCGMACSAHYEFIGLAREGA